MIMAQSNKHLFELLKEDQEPFFLKDYIADRRFQLLTKTNHDHHAKKIIKRSPKTTTITKPSVKSLPQKLLSKNACFSSTSKSPLFEFPLSPISIKRSPCKRAPTSPTQNPILLHIPAKTAALLLEAALRIQKQSSNNGTNNKSKPKPQKFGLFGSLLKRLTSHRSHKKKEMLVAKSPPSLIKASSDNNFNKYSCSGPSSRASGVWSESNEEKSMDFSTSTSETSRSEESVGFVAKLMMLRAQDDHDHDVDDDEGFVFCDESTEFCDQSPFRFVLQRTPSSSPSSFSGRRTPEFSSPVASPARRRTKQEGKENYVTESSKGFQAEEELEEEEKEQFSPVSVLDPPFEDDYDRADDEDHEDEDADADADDEEEEDGFDLESSYAIVQRTKQQLLKKLRRFEKLAELDPIELEKRMLEEEDEDDDEEEEEEECEETSDLDGFIREVLISNSSFCHSHQGPGQMKRLVSDLIVEEQKLVSNRGQEEIVKGVVKRFESWKEVQSNTIDMMVEQDFRKELEAWKDNKEQIGETAIEIELAIFGLLVEELAQELVCLSGN